MAKPVISTIVVLVLSVAAALSGAAFSPPTYTGATTWNASNRTFYFESSGTLPNTKESFYWQVPPEVRKIVIRSGVTVTGGFRIPFRAVDNPLEIAGESRETSVIFGTDTEQWTTRNGIADNEKWRHGAVAVLADASVCVSNLTSRNPRGYHISGYAGKAVLHVSRCNLIDARSGANNNSDGFVGGAGSSITDSLISTSDDAIKIYRDMLVRNVTIKQRRNGAPIQFGWDGETGDATASITNLTIIGIDPEGLYNMAPFSWHAGTTGTRTVTVHGLKVNLSGKIYDRDKKRWRSAGLLQLNPPGCTLNMDVVGGEIGGLPYGFHGTRGRVTVNGAEVPLGVEEPGGAN